MKLQVFDKSLMGGGPGDKTYLFFCPGCECRHTYTVRAPGSAERPAWTFNGDMDRPTFTPSLLYPDKTPRCHLFLTDGRLQFLDDCGHALAGKTVDLPAIPEDMRM
ncbi:MAG: hypothetical protein K2V38_10005 [Gemmataceae bacterium]|nr:hypothetical protein [Gemmataceae bacterium]